MQGKKIIIYVCLTGILSACCSRIFSTSLTRVAIKEKGHSFGHYKNTYVPGEYYYFTTWYLVATLK